VTGDLESIVRALCADLPRAIGVVLCDWEGEAVVCAVGSAEPPEEAEARVKEHVPQKMALNMPIAEFLIRLAGAEPCGLLRSFEASGSKTGAGGLEAIEVRYESVEMIVHRLPNEFYLMVLLRRPAITAEARRKVGDACVRLREHVR
jgi:hypothetical protein